MATIPSSFDALMLMTAYSFSPKQPPAPHRGGSATGLKVERGPVAQPGSGGGGGENNRALAHYGPAEK